MFSKLKGVFSKFNKSTEDKPTKEKTQTKEAAKKEPPKAKKGLFKKLSKKKIAKKDLQNSKENRGFFKKITERKLESLIEELEEGLIQNNVAYDVAKKIVADLKESKAKEIKSQLQKSIKEILTSAEPIDLIKLAKEKKQAGEPFVIAFVGVNGTGKTTQIAKLAYMFKKKGFSCVLAAGDTFRAGAISQLEKHADKLDVRIVKHDYGSDPAAVAYDAVHAKGAEVVLIDTAGRQHAHADLMDELVKVKRVAKPDLTILIIDSLTGSDCVTQAEQFNDKIGIDGSILTKADADERGGAILSVLHTIRKPVLFIGVGQNYDDLERFDADKMLKMILG